MTVKQKTLKGLLLDTTTQKAAIVEIEDSLESFYERLHCSTIDIVDAKIGDEIYSVVCDDEAAIRDIPQVVSFVSRRRILINSIFICKCNSEGELISVSSEDEKNLVDHVLTVGGQTIVQAVA